MRVSGKITHSFYCFLRERGFNVSRLFELTSLEMEFLKNPSQWMDIELVESFLKKIDGEYSSHFVDRDFIAVVGRSCFELNAWGELDSVLKMRKKEPVFSHLPMFLSYFIDGLSLVEERVEQGFLSFQSNCSSENYPHITSYLKAVIESLPLYTDKPRASALWIRNYIQVKWEETNPQTSLFPPSSEENIRPELLSDFRQFLEKIEKELYNNRQRIEEKRQTDSEFKRSAPHAGDLLAEQGEGFISRDGARYYRFKKPFAFRRSQTGTREKRRNRGNRGNREGRGGENLHLHFGPLS